MLTVKGGTVSLKKQDEKKRRAFYWYHNQEGVSLLELIVAISMFSIAALALLQGFAQSAQVNKKTEKYQQVSTLAQNLMEEIRAKSIGEMSLAFNYPIDKVQNGMSRFSFLLGQESMINQGDDAIVIREVLKTSAGGFDPVRTYRENMVDETKITSSTLSKDDGKTWSFIPRTEGSNRSKYYFEMSNVETNGEKVDILLTYDGSKSSGYKKDDSNYNAQDEKNDMELPNIQKLNTDENAFFLLEEDWDKSSVEERMIAKQYEYAKQCWEEDRYEYEQTHPAGEFESLYPEPTVLDYEEVWKKTKRKLVVSIQEEKGITKAIGQYYLDASGYSDGTKYGSMNLSQENGDTNWTFYQLESLPITFFSTEPGNDLNNLYIFYYPNYDSLNQGIYDEIVIQNEQNLPVNVYVVKQSRKTEDGQSVPTKTQEEQYKMRLTVEETPSLNGNSNWFVNSGLFQSQTQLFTNLNTDTSIETVQERKSLSQMTLSFKDSRTNRTVRGRAAQLILQMSGLDSQEVKDRIYNVTLEIYPEGSASKNYEGEEPILTWNTSKTD